MDTKPHSHSHFYVWFFACSAVWACVETPEGAGTSGEMARAFDGTSTGSEPPFDSVDGTTTSGVSNDVGNGPEDPNEQIPQPDSDGCPGIYAQDLLPTFELTLDPDVLDTLEEEWLEGPERDEEDEETHFYHPLAEFRYGEIVIHDAEIRLRGNAKNWDDDDKMQFQIGFSRNNKSGRFLGLERLLFDAATVNRHMLRDRLALQIMRDMGITAPCANNARLDINGEYYGIFVNLEKIDEVFLERTFDDPTGDLWKRANWELKTNEKTADDTRLEALEDAETIEELETYLDLEQALRVYAADAIIPNSDGPWAGGLNGYLYDDPISGKFMLLPWDLDTCLEQFDGSKNDDYPKNPDPVVWEKPTTHGRPWYEIALSDEDWFWYYIDVIEEQFESGYAIDVLEARIETWTEQIEASVLEDTNKPYSNKKYEKAVEDLEDYVEDRHEFLEEWLECWQDGGQPDKKGYCD